LWRREYYKDGSAKLKEVHPGAVDLSRPTLIYCTGYLTTHTQPGYVSGSIKALEELLGGGEDLYKQMEIYGTSNKNRHSAAFNVSAYNYKSSEHHTLAEKEFVENVFLKSIAKNGKLHSDGRISGEKRPLKEVREKFQNLTLYGYSYGTIVAQAIHNALREAMLDIGYKQEEITDLAREIVLINVGNVTRPEKEANRFTSLVFQGTNDRPVFLKDLVWRSGEKRLFRKPKELSITRLSERCLFLTTHFNKEMYRWKKIEDKYEYQKIDKLLPKWVPFYSVHEMDYYVTQKETDNEFARIIANALRNAVTRNGSPDVAKLLEVSPPISSNKQKGDQDPNIPKTFDDGLYKSKITNGFVRGNPI
jgi:hypothetical protein